ncbi:MAG: DUF547 domain-containing protein [Planctomycetes bacterium]|nr:DUF547 domain-containing protein [Planctomycetota bacterium]
MSIVILFLLEFAQGESERTADHSSYSQLLKKYADKDGYVYYKGWKENRGDLESLNLYLGSLGKVDPDKLSKKEKLAFWINAYNALTIKGILEFYPIKSIKDKVSSFFGYNIWKDYILKINGKEYSLNDIEHKILRKMEQPLIHFGLVCASIGCPRLLNEAYTGNNVIKQLENNAKNFFKTGSKFKIDKNKKYTWLSLIFKWFWDDFGDSQEEILKFIAKYTDEETSKFLKQEGLKIYWLDYDWNLNERKEPIEKDN